MKKTTTKTEGAKVSARLRSSAEAIINNSKRYDAGTRKAIRRALREQHADLADCVRYAESGDTVNDLTAAEVEANAERAELREFATHLAAVLRIARSHPAIPSGLYNDLADAWNNFLNEMPSLSEFQESTAFISMALDLAGSQRAARKGSK